LAKWFKAAVWLDGGVGAGIVWAKDGERSDAAPAQRRVVASRSEREGGESGMEGIDAHQAEKFRAVFAVGIVT
jgi:hypothetical protein